MHPLTAAETKPLDSKKRALGKGLESLLPARPSTTSASQQAPEGASQNGRPLELPVDQIDRNPFQTRTTFDETELQELANSISASGVVQPIVVRQGVGGRYLLITGERRLLASRKAGKSTIPAILREASDQQAMEMTVIENLQRTDLNAIEQAHAYHRLSREFHLTQEQMAERTGKDRTSVANFLRLLKLPETVQLQVADGVLSFGHARALLALPADDLILSAAQKVIALHLSVRSTEKMVHTMLHPDIQAKAEVLPAVDPNVRSAQDQLRRALGLKVTIEDKRGKGRVIIEYSGVDDFDTILQALGEAVPE